MWAVRSCDYMTVDSKWQDCITAIYPEADNAAAVVFLGISINLKQIPVGRKFRVCHRKF